MAEENLVTNIVAKSDFSGLIGDLNKVSSRLTELQQQLNNTNKTLAVQAAAMQKSFASTMRSTGQFSTHFVSLSSDVDKFGKSLDSGKLKLGQYYRAWQDHAKTSGGLIRDLAKQQVQMQNAILQPLGKNAQGLQQFNVHIPRGLDVVKSKTAIARQELMIMNKVIQDGANQVINWGKNTQWAGRQLSVGLTLPIVAFGKAASDAFKVADQELVRLTKVYGGLAATSAQELGRVRQEVSATAKQLATEYGASYTETIALAADIAATGKQGADLVASTKETTRLAILGEVDRQEAMKATLSIQTAFKQNTEQLSESINFLNAVENQTSTSLADLVEAIPKAGPVVQALGGSVQDLALYLTAMREGGVNASEGANALKSALASIINPTKVAREMFQGFGIDLGGIVTKNAGNLTGTILAIQSALDTLDPLKKSQAIEQLFGKFQFARMNALFSNLGKQGSQTLQVLDLMKASSQDLANIAGRELVQVTESASGKYKRAVESLKADLAGVGENFLSISTTILNTVDGIIKFFNKLPAPIKTAMGFLTALTAMTGPIIMLTGLLANFFGYIVKGIFHLKSLFKGGEGFKLLTPEILAAQKAASTMETTFYSDAKAAAVLKQAIASLAGELTVLEQKANSATVAVNPAITTVAGNVIAAGSGRVADPNHPLIGPAYSRASAHLNPVAGMTQQERLAQTIFGMAPAPIPVNQKIGKNPQMYMSGDMPKIEGVTSIKGASTGIVAEEAAKWHAMTAALSMQSEAEIKALKSEVAATGTITSELSGSYQALLPEMTSLTRMAAEESRVIVAELQAGKTTVDQARAKIMQLNATVEAMMAETTASIAATQGRTANITTVPLTGQPVVDPVTGKSNMKEMFHKTNTSNLVDKIARALGVRTSGGGYSIETTKPKRFAMGGNVVPGTGNSDTVPAMLTPGEFVINKEATASNLPLLEAINGGKGSNGLGKNLGGIISRLLPSMVQKLPRGFIPEGSSKVFARAFFDTKTGGNVTKQREWLNDSMSMFGRLYPKSGGGFYKPSDLSKMSDAEVRGLWKGIEKGHFSGKRTIEGTDNYFVPGAMGPQSSSANKKAISGGNPAAFADDLENVPIHPMVIMRSAAEALGYSGNPKQFMKAYNSLIAALRGRAKSQSPAFGQGDTFEMFSERVLAKHLNRVGGKTNSNFFDELLSYGTVRGRQEGRSTTASGEKKSGIGSLYTARIAGYRAGGRIPSLPSSVIERLTSRWPKPRQFYKPGYQYKLGNQDPLHGPLQIGLSQNLNQYAGSDPTKFSAESVAYRDPQFDRLNVMPAFLTGDQKRRGLYSTSRYMAGDLDIMSQMERLGTHELGPIAAMKSLQTKFSGKLYRGILANSTQNAMPKHIQEAILNAKQTGDWSAVVGKEFIMRRSSWSKDKMIADYFAMKGNSPDSILLEAAVRNRNILDAASLFPNRVFRAPYGQAYPQGKFGGPVERSEKEAIFGGKFKIVGYKNGAIQIETVAEAREKGGPVNAGKPYLVGEKGPELFVPRNSGGIVPHYKLGGMVAQNIGAIGGSMLGSTIGNSLAGPMGGFAGSMLGGMLPMMFAGRGRSAEGGYSAPGGSLLAGSKYGESLTQSATGGSKLTGVLSKLALAITRTNAVLALGTSAAFGAYKIWKNHQENLRLAASSYGLTADAAQKAGLKYVDYNTKIKDSISNIKLLIDKNKIIAEGMTSAKTPFNLTITEYKKLQKEIKATMSDQVKLFDKTGMQNVSSVAVRLKEQFMAAGMSAEDAAKKIYTMMSLSNKSGMAASTVGGKAFSSIDTPEKASVGSFKQFNVASQFGDAKAQAAALNTALMSVDTGIASIMRTAEDKAKKDKTNFDAVKAQYSAENEMINMIKNNVKSQKTLSADLLDELKKQNPEIRSFANESDTALSIWQKLKIAAAGFTGDLSKVGSAGANALYKMTKNIQSTVETTNRNGILKSQYKSLQNLQDQAERATKAMAGQSAKQQISDRDAIKAIDKKIAAINKEAEARIKAIRKQQDAESFTTDMKKKQLEYQDALASGDMSRAAQAQLDIQQMTSAKQASMAEESIINARDKKLAPLEKQKNAIGEKQQDLADSAALASDNIGTLNKRIQDQKDKIDAVNQAMTNLVIAQVTHTGNISDLAKVLQKTIKDSGITGTTGKTATDLVNAILGKDSAFNKNKQAYSTSPGGISSDITGRAPYSVGPGGTVTVNTTATMPTGNIKLKAPKVQKPSGKIDVPKGKVASQPYNIPSLTGFTPLYKSPGSKISQSDDGKNTLNVYISGTNLSKNDIISVIQENKAKLEATTGRNRNK